MVDSNAFRVQHARRQLGYGIILLLTTIALAFLIRVYLAYSPGDTGMPLTYTNRTRLWAIPVTWALATCCALVSSFRFSRGAKPTTLNRHFPLLCLLAGTAANFFLVAVARLFGMS